jgi:hypothetical protein
VAAAGVAGVGRNRRSGGGFAWGKAEKRERETGNAFRGSGRGTEGRRRRMVVRRGTVATASDCAR